MSFQAYSWNGIGMALQYHFGQFLKRLTTASLPRHRSGRHIHPPPIEAFWSVSKAIDHRQPPQTQVTLHQLKHFGQSLKQLRHTNSTNSNSFYQFLKWLTTARLPRQWPAWQIYPTMTHFNTLSQWSMIDLHIKQTKSTLDWPWPWKLKFTLLYRRTLFHMVQA